MKGWRSVAVAVCGWAAGVALAAMLLVTVADVLLRAAFNLPLRGTFEIVELLLACTFFLALPAMVLRDDHILVDIVDGYAPPMVPLLQRIAQALAVAVLAVMAWQGWVAAQDTLVFKDVTADLALPRIWYWIPVLAGMIGAGVAAAIMLFSPRRRDR